MASLRGYRPCPHTYCKFDYDKLPALDVADLKGSFDWLMLEDTVLERMTPYYDPQNADNIRRALPLCQAALAEVNITLPTAFLTLFENPERLRLFPSCTACYFETIPPIPSPMQDGAWVQTFLFDQQSVLVWSLYLHPDGEYAVVVEDEALGALIEGDAYIPPNPETYRQHTSFVGEDIESFLYRFWLENRLWFKLYDDLPLSAAEQAYLNHYVE